MNLLSIFQQKPANTAKEIFLFVGLGNIGEKYTQTRHNVGFMFANYLVEKESFLNFSEQTKFFSFVTEKMHHNHKIIIAKPQTYMNESGKAVQKIKSYYKINTENIIVVHDDLDIEFGNYKFQKSKGPRIHNGIISIEQYLKTKNFNRIRIGIESRTPEQKGKFKGRDFVLSRFTEKEIDTLQNKIFDKILLELKTRFLTE